MIYQPQTQSSANHRGRGAGDTAIEEMAALAEAFARLVRERAPDRLDRWLAAAEASGVPGRLEDDDALFAEKLDLLLRLRAAECVTWSGRCCPPLADAPQAVHSRRTQ